MTASALERLVAEIRAEGGLLGAAVGKSPSADPGATAAAGPGATAAAGPRAQADPTEYALLVEAIYEGYRQHYAAPRLMADAEPDLRLLAGDRLYAIGLERLVGLGDVAAVIELADVISLCALAHARGAQELAEPLWRAAATAVGCGTSRAHEEAKALVWAGDERAAAALAAVGGAQPIPPGTDRR